MSGSLRVRSTSPVRGSSLRGLGEHVAQSLDEERLAAGGAARVRARLASGEPRRPAPKLAVNRTMVAMLAATLCMALALVLVVRAHADRPRITFDVGAARTPDVAQVGAFLSAPPDAELPVSFSEGTKVTLRPGARARIAETSERGARVLLERGALHASVVHRPDAKWAVDAGPFEVRVTGTRFEVSWDPERETVTVLLEEGGVTVSGCALGSGRRVVAGERFVAACNESAKTTPVEPWPAAPPPVTSALPAPAETVVEAKSPRAPPPSPPVPTAAELGAPVTSTASKLLKSAEAARYEGRHDAARATLLELRKQYPNAPEATIAAFELGRNAFDIHRAYGEAADWFETYLKEQPNGGFSREAMGRALEATTRLADAAPANAELAERARKLGERYLASYPNGPHSRLARRTVFGGEK